MVVMSSSFVAGSVLLPGASNADRARAVVTAAAHRAQSQKLPGFDFELLDHGSIAVAHQGGRLERVQAISTEANAGAVVYRFSSNPAEAKERATTILHHYQQGRGQTEIVDTLRAGELLLLWDRESEYTLLAYAPGSLCPIHVRSSDGTLAFASQPELLSKTGSAAHDLSAMGLVQFLSTGFVPPAGRLKGSNDGTAPLEPGTILVLRRGVASHWRASPVHNPAKVASTNGLAGLCAALPNAADYGSLLTGGGLHSALLTAAMVQSGARPQLVCFGLGAINEYPQAGTLADRLGLPLKILELVPDNLFTSAVQFGAKGATSPIDNLAATLLAVSIHAAGGRARTWMTGLGGRSLWGEGANADLIDPMAFSGLLRHPGTRSALASFPYGNQSLHWEPGTALPKADDHAAIGLSVLPTLAHILGLADTSLSAPYCQRELLEPWVMASKQAAAAANLSLRDYLSRLLPVGLSEQYRLSVPGQPLFTRRTLMAGRKDEIIQGLTSARQTDMAGHIDLDAAITLANSYYDGNHQQETLLWRLYLLGTWYTRS